MKELKFGAALSELLIEIEDTIFKFELFKDEKPNYTKEGFRAAVKIFSSVLMDKIYELQEGEDIEFEDRCNMAQKAGEDLRKLVKTYTDIDTRKLY